MSQTLVVRGRYVGRTFIPDGPLPEAEGTAELVISLAPTPARGSIADAFGTAAAVRTGDDILAQLRADHDEWEDR